MALPCHRPPAKVLAAYPIENRPGLAPEKPPAGSLKAREFLPMVHEGGPSRTNYGNWELSADRANAAPRLMQGNGVRADRVTQVRGFADQRLRKPDAPLDPANRGISLIV